MEWIDEWLENIKILFKRIVYRHHVCYKLNLSELAGGETREWVLSGMNQGIFWTTKSKDSMDDMHYLVHLNCHFAFRTNSELVMFKLGKP